MAQSVVRLVALVCYCSSTLLTLDARLTPPPALPTVHRPVHNRSTLANADLVTADESTLSGVWSSGDEVCRSFVHLPNTVSLSAETLRKVGDGYRAEECRQACIDSTDFVCVAAQMHLPSTCFVTGFRLRNDYISVHYTRVCEHGPPCFLPVSGVSAAFTRSVAIPSQYLGNSHVYPLYCMAACELTTSCVGFDLLAVDAQPRCAFLDLQIFPSASFNLDIRRC